MKNSILGSTKIIEDAFADPKTLGYLEAVKTAGKTLLNLINDILDFSKIDSVFSLFEQQEGQSHSVYSGTGLA